MNDLIDELKFTSNKIADCLDNCSFESHDRKILRDAIDLLESEASNYENLKNEREYWE